LHHDYAFSGHEFLLFKGIKFYRFIGAATHEKEKEIAVGRESKN